MFCGKCGTQVPEEFAFCTKCGSAVSEAPPKAGQEKGGASKVGRWRTIFLVLSLVLVTWVGSAGIAYGVVELSGGGPQGEQGEQGERGSRDFSTSIALRRLAAMWTFQTLMGAPGAEACIDYIMDGTGSFVECGFTR